MRILIKNGRVIDPINNIDEIRDILIVDNYIAMSEKNINSEHDKCLDASNKWVVPGLIDLHVHLREPGFTHKETIITGSQSAIAGGVTTICAMPNTNPVIDHVDIAKYVVNKAKEETSVNVLPIGSITIGQKGKELSNYSEMKPYICAISEDGGTVKNAKLMKEAIICATNINLPIFAHCEDLELKNHGQISKGIASDKFKINGISNDCEDVIVARDIVLSEEIKAKLHICHVSTRGSIDLIRFGKVNNKNLTCEVAPHHFSLIDEDIHTLDANYKMSPPLRSEEDRASILQALHDDIIDVIATDHAPHSEEEKNNEFSKAPNGIVGLETLVPLCITNLVNKNIITPKQFVEKTSVNPAKIINIDKGNLGIGKIADIAIIDVTTTYNIDVNKFSSKSKNSPFHGVEVVGKVVNTIIDGVIVK